MIKYFFPFEKIHPGANLVIYGAGEVGMQYIQQVLLVGVYKLVCVIDREAERLKSDYVQILDVDDIKNISFDYIVIAIKNEKVANKIKMELCDKYLVDNKKIIWVDPIRPICNQKMIRGVLPYGASKSEDKITMGVFIGPGFGDAICSKKIIVALAEAAGFVCEIDLYVDRITFEFVKGLYVDCPYVKNVYQNEKYNFNKCYTYYDLAYRPEYIFDLVYYDKETLLHKNTSFACTVIKIDEYLNKEGLKDKRGIANYVQFKRCELRGENVYTVNAFRGILPIMDNHVNVPLLPHAEKDYLALQLKIPYITLNYGWGKNQHDKSHIPSKIWPVEYFQELIKKIKIKHPNLLLIQIARGDAPRMPLVDCCYRDLDIEVVKFLLKNTSLHIDSEGGMVHLASQLGTKCMVFFGPTSVKFFGYKDNINIVSSKCSNCYYMDNDITRCIRDLSRPECMYSITPEMAFEKFEECVKWMVR